MTPKERAAMQQALECAERCESIDGMYSWADTITALREALAEQAEQEPFAWMHPSGGCLSAHYMKEFATGLEKETHTIPLYASPVRTKDLTDDEIWEALHDKGLMEGIRAVIAKDREKNK